jgi:hypothetical protein
MVAMRGSVDIGGAWHAVGTAGFVTGNWARPQGMPGVALDLGWGVGRSSADGMQVIELRAQHTRVVGYTSHGALLTWRIALL